MTLAERLTIALAAGALSSGVTFVLGGSHALIVVCGIASTLLTLILRDVFVLFFGWDD